MKLLVTLPHSGEKIPTQCFWLNQLPEPILFADADRYVDQLYLVALNEIRAEVVSTQWHRYVVDLNRVPEDTDVTSLEGSPNPAGTHPRGFHWVHTTKKETILPKPLSRELHLELKRLVYDEFHSAIEKSVQKLKLDQFEIFHLDLHSMPSLGTSEHRDPGEQRADIVVSDCDGKSSSREFLELVLSSFKNVGFQVSYNWPYKGGRITERYGHPEKKHNTIQIELNRRLYMDEVTKKPKIDLWPDLQLKLGKALHLIQSGLDQK